MGVQNENSTGYVHPDEPNLLNLHKAMEYNGSGEPVVRTSVAGNIVIENVEIGNVEISNDAGNPIPISANTSVNSASNPIYVKGSSDTSFFFPTQLDAFARLRISNPETIFDCQQIHVESPEFTTTLVGGATKTYVESESCVFLTVGTANNDEAIRQTKRVMPYQPGKSLLLFNTFVFNTPKAGLRQRSGYFDADNGIFFETDGTTNYLVLRSKASGSIVERRVAQSSWNGDKFDGYGISASQPDRTPGQPTLDVTKANIMWMDIEWLGVGDVRVGFVVDGTPIIAHTFHNDNRNTTVYMQTACLPLRYEIKNTSSQLASSTMKQICATVISEGGYTLKGKIHGCGRGFTIAQGTSLNTAGTEYPLIAIRLREGRKYSVAIPNLYQIFVNSNATVSYRIWIGADVSGGTWEYRPEYSSVEFNVGVTGATYTSADLVQGGFVTATSAIKSGTDLQNLLYQLQYWADGTRPIILLTAIPTQNNITVLSKVDWVELV